ncbi:MAG TPA: TolC family protein [Lentimicrobium sp.]|nr:TolC family protein [Lentimicrobium sp.]
MARKDFKGFLLSLLLVLFFSSLTVSAQEVKIITLDEAMIIARKQSPDALSAMHRFRSSYWQYRNYKADLMPALTLDATIPSLSDNIYKIQTENGDVFSRYNQVSYSSGLSLTKNLSLTGGQIFLNSDLERIDYITDDSTSFRSSPLNIGIRQPIFSFNKYKWLKKIEPLKYDEAQRRYLEDVETVSLNAANAFFRLLDAQMRLKIAKTNSANNDTLYQIARGRFNIGTIAENELLQIELSLLNSRSAVEEANLEVEMRLFDLRSFLRIPENVQIELLAPAKPPVQVVNTQDAIAQARLNRADALAFDRRLLEADSRVNEARSSGRLNANLYAVYGLSQSSQYFEDVYRQPLEGKTVQFGITLPILDWGLERGKIKLAESDRELERNAVQQNIKDFDQEVLLKVMQYNMQPIQYAIAAKSDTVAQKRYEVTKQRYLIGKIGITDLNIAQNEKDNAQQGYISALATYWRSYFELRKLTLFDYEQGKPITFNFNDIPDVD